jgi:hypothetical protein
MRKLTKPNLNDIGKYLFKIKYKCENREGMTQNV